MMTQCVISLMVILSYKGMLVMKKPTTAQMKFLKKALAKMKEETVDISVRHLIEVPSLEDSIRIEAVFYIQDVDKVADFLIEHVDLDQLFDLEIHKLPYMAKNIVFELESYGEFDSLIQSGLEFQGYTDIY